MRIIGSDPALIARITKLALEIVGVLVAGAIIAVLALGWRLTTGPISLDFARGMLQDALAPRDLPIEVEIGEPVFTWKGWTRVFDVTVKDVTLNGYDGALKAHAPSVQVRLSVSAMVNGIAAPVRITVNQPTIELSGALTANHGGSPVDAKWAAAILHEIATPAVAADRLSHLRLVEINDATVKSRGSDQAELNTMRGLNAKLARHPGVLRINATTVAAIGETVTNAALNITYDDTNNRVTGSANLNGVPFASLSRALPGISKMLTWSAPLDTDLTFVLQPPWKLQKASGSLLTKKGELGLPSMYSKPRPLESVSFDMAYNAATDSLDVSSLELVQDDITAIANLSIKDLSEGAAISFKASTENFPGHRLSKYWPANLAVDARRWVLGNLEGGTVPNAVIELEARIDPAAPLKPKMTRLDGAIEFKDVTGYYFRPLPPVTEIEGRAEFDLQKFVISIRSARLNDMDLEKTVVRLTELHNGREKAEIDASIRGPIHTALEILDHDILALAKRIGLDSDRITGLAGTRLRFAFPLINTLTLGQVDFAASSNMEGVGIPDIAAGHALSNGKLTLDLTRDGLRIDGTGLIAGTEANVTMDEVFTPNARIRKRRRLSGNFDDTTVKALGLPSFLTLAGPVLVDVEMLELADGQSEVSAILDLRATTLGIPALKWEKPAGSAGRVRFSLDMIGERVQRLRSASLLAADLGIDISAEFTPETGVLKHVQINQLVFADSTMTGDIDVEANGLYRVTVEGDRLDIRRFLEDEDEDAAPSPPGPRVVIKARFKEVQIGTLPPITDADMDLSNDGTRLNDIQLNGRVGGEPITIGFTVAENAKRFEIRAEDAGRVLRGFDLLNSISDGRLAITGVTTGEGANEHTVIDLSVRDFGLINAPVLAQVLNAAFLPGLVDILQGKGIRFERLTAKIDVTEERARILDALAYGSSLGISASGEIDRIGRVIDINGMIVPAYGLSRLIDQIPILGRIITGGEKEGLLAAEYLVDGGLDTPTVTVNPLTALTPGFLRALVKATNDPAVRNGKTSSPAQGDGPGR
jgi:hypothetical protein